MRIKLFVGFMLFFLIISVSACGNADEEFKQEAMEVGESFLKTLYNEDATEFDVEDIEIINDVTDEYSEYLTEDELDELTIRRFLLIPKEIAANQNMAIAIENIEWDTDESDDTEMDFKHTFTLIFTDESGEVLNEEMSGQMTVVKTDEGPKISRYHDTGVPEELLYLE